MSTVFTRIYLDGQARANRVDPDEMPQNVSSGTTLFLETIVGSKLFKFYNTYGKEEVSEYLG